MRAPEESILLRIFVGEADRHHGKPLYEAIVAKARELGLAGATVLKGILGFGAESHLHASKLLALSEDLPIVIELVDDAESIERLLPFLDDVIEEGLVTMETVRAFRYPRPS